MEPAIPAVGTCQGYLPEGWTRDFFILNYPHHVHSSLGEPHRPTISWEVMSGFRGLKHIQCTGLPGCGPCEGLVFNSSLRKILETAVRPALRTPHVCLGFTSIQQKLEMLGSKHSMLSLKCPTCAAKLTPCAIKKHTPRKGDYGHSPRGC